MPTEDRGRRPEMSLQRCDSKSGYQKLSIESTQEGEGWEHLGQREPVQPVAVEAHCWVFLAGVWGTWDLELGSVLKCQEESFAGHWTHGEATWDCLHPIQLPLLTVRPYIAQPCWEEHLVCYWISEKIIRIFYCSPIFLPEAILKRQTDLTRVK